MATIANPVSVVTAPWIPSDNGLLAATGDPGVYGSSNTLTAGTVYLVKIPIRAALTITNVWWALQTAGAGASTGSFSGIYSSAGSLLSGSSDIDAQLTGATGGFSVPLTTPQAVAAGSFVWAAILSNLATTQPTLCRGLGTVGVPNLNLAAAVLRSATNGVGQTNLPASITPAANAVGQNYWAGVN